MKRALVILAVVMGLGLPSGAWANRAAAKKTAYAAQQAKRQTRPESARSVILHRMRSRGIVKPAKRLFANSGIAGGPTLIFSEQNALRRVTRKGARTGETEVVNVSGVASPSKTNKSGWSVRMKITPVEAPAPTLGE